MTRNRQAILLAYLTLGAFFVAHSINAYVSQALVQPVTSQTLPVATAVPARTPVGSPRLAEEIANSGLFVSARVPGGTGSPEAIAQAKPLDATKKIKLVGTVVGDGLSALAVLEDVQTKKQLLYHLYERIPDLGQIMEIRRNGIVVQEGQQREFVELSTGMINHQASVPMGNGSRVTAPLPGRVMGNKITLDRRTVSESVADVPKLLTQAQAVPFYTDGKLEGWRMESIKPGSLYEKIGLLAGDVLQRVNGVEIRDPGVMLTLFQQVRNESQVKLDLLRTNQRTTLTYDIR